MKEDEKKIESHATEFDMHVVHINVDAANVFHLGTDKSHLCRIESMIFRAGPTFREVTVGEIITLPIYLSIGRHGERKSEFRGLDIMITEKRTSHGYASTLFKDGVKENHPVTVYRFNGKTPSREPVIISSNSYYDKNPQLGWAIKFSPKLVSCQMGGGQRIQ